LGVDNGAGDNVQPHKSNEITTRNGRALLIVQTKASVGAATINVSADGLEGAELGLSIKAATIQLQKTFKHCHLQSRRLIFWGISPIAKRLAAWSQEAVA
tara:strand:- start:229 stop:528 length:300 start_codon:yes stop_codon:yes gene_type:complete